MEFTNTILLWTALGSLLPILLHLLNRQTPKKITIPTVQFIIKAAQKTSANRQLNNIFLLCLRIAILLLITFFIAGPFFSTPQNENSEKSPVLFIIDNSFYSAHRIGRSNQLAIAQEKALKIIHNLDAATPICILTTDQSHGQFSQIKEYAVKNIKNLSPSNDSIDIHKLLAQATTLLDDKVSKNDSGQVYIISDMNSGTWQDRYKTLSTRHKIFTIQIPKRLGNRLILGTQTFNNGHLHKGSIPLGRDIQIRAHILGDIPLVGCVVQLRIDNQVIEEKTISEEKFTTQLSFTHKFTKLGSYFAEIKIISEDALSEDNTHYFCIKVSEPQEIHILSDNKETSAILEAALCPSIWRGRQKYKIKHLRYDNLDEFKRMNSPKSLILTGSLELTSQDWSLIDKFIRSGTKVTISPDETTQVSALHQGLFPYFQTETQLVENEPVALLMKTTQKNHFLGSSMKYHLSDILNKKYFTLDLNNDSDAETFIHYANEKACFISQDIDLGELLFLGLVPHQNHSNFLNSNSFSLLWHKIAQRITAKPILKTSFSCGDTILIKAQKGDIQNFTITSPTEFVDTFTKEDFDKEGHGYTKLYKETNISGHFRCSSTEFPGFSCNIKRSPAFYNYPAKETHSPLHQAPTLSSSQTLLDQDNILKLILIALLIFIGYETHVSNRANYVKH